MPFANLLGAVGQSALSGGGGIGLGVQRQNENSGAISSLLQGFFDRKGQKQKTRRAQDRVQTGRQASSLFFNAEDGVDNPFGDLDQGFQDILAELVGFGSGRRASIEQGAKESLRSTQATLQGRGLGSSVLFADAERGSERQRQLLLGNLDDDITEKRLAARGQNQSRLFNQQQLLAQLLG